MSRLRPARVPAADKFQQTRARGVFSPTIIMSDSKSIPSPILQKLKGLDPDSSYYGTLPRIFSSSGAVYYAKLGSPIENEQYSGEAQSLVELDKAAPGLVPRLLCYGTLEDGKPFFISEYAEISTLSYRAADVLAKRMALELHSEEHASSNGYGFSIPTYCGVTKLSNGWFDTWEKCYASMTGDLLSQLESKGRYRALCTKGEVVKNE